MANAEFNPALSTSSGTARSSIVERTSSSTPSASVAYAPVHTRGRNPWSSLASGSGCSGTSLVGALPMSATDLVQASSTDKVRNLAQRSVSRPDGLTALAVSTEARRTTGSSAYALHNPHQTATHGLGTAERVPQAMATQPASNVLDTSSRRVEATGTTTPQVSGSNVTSMYSSISSASSGLKHAPAHAPLPASLPSSRTSATTASSRAAHITHQNMGQKQKDGHTPVESRPSKSLPSSTPTTHGKASPLTHTKPASNTARSSLASAPAHTNTYTSLMATAPKADVQQAALAAMSVVASGYLLGLASALTGELLRSLAKRPKDRSCRGLSGDGMMGSRLVS